MTGGLGNVALIAALAVVPLVVLMLTSFVKISVVLSLLRNAIGAPDAPSGLVVTGLSLILTFFVMAPVAIDMAHAAAASPSPSAPRSPPPAPMPPHPAGSSAPTPRPAVSSAPGVHAPAESPVAGTEAKAAAGTEAKPLAPGAGLDAAFRELVPEQYRPHVDAVAKAVGPLRAFLTRHASPRDRETFTGLASRMGRTVTGDELWVLAPAFVTTELREAFAIAVLLFVPFMVIDLVVGLGLAALGLSSTSPQVIALPFKLMLFVSVDGWRLLLDALIRGYV
jgi:type III secretion protein R